MSATVCWGSTRNRDCILYPGKGTVVLIRPAQTFYERIKLKVVPMESVRDLPDGDWRRIQKADGYHYTIVNGEVTFEGQKCTGSLPGKLLRSNEMTV